MDMAAPWKQIIDRFGALPTAMAGGFVTGVSTLLIPNGWFEKLVVVTGVSEIISAAAPPLGITARIAIAVATALLVFGILVLLLTRDTDQNEYEEDGDVSDLNFAADDDWQDDTQHQKLSWQERLRGMLPVWGNADPNDVRDLEDLPKLRREDRHPDAPARAPLRAGRDLADNDEGNLNSASSSAPNSKQGETAIDSVRKRLGNLIPMDLISNDEMAVGEMPLVAKKPKSGRAVDQEAHVEPVSINNEPNLEESTRPEMAAQSDVLAMASAEDVRDESHISASLPPDDAYDVVHHQDAAVEGDSKIDHQVTAQDGASDLGDLSLGALIERLESGLDRLASAQQAAIVDDAPKGGAVDSSEDIALAEADQVEPQDAVVSDEDVSAGEAASTTGTLPEQAIPEQPIPEQPIVEKPVESSGVPMAHGEQKPITDPDEMDEALRAALETLRQMTEKQRNA